MSVKRSAKKASPIRNSLMAKNKLSKQGPDANASDISRKKNKVDALTLDDKKSSKPKKNVALKHLTLQPDVIKKSAQVETKVIKFKKNLLKEVVASKSRKIDASPLVEKVTLKQDDELLAGIAINHSIQSEKSVTSDEKLLDKKIRVPTEPPINSAKADQATALSLRVDGLTSDYDLATALGIQAADLFSHLNRWFERVIEKVDELSVRVEKITSVSVTDAAVVGEKSSQVAHLEKTTAFGLVQSQKIFDYKYIEKWDKWNHHQAAKMLADGVVELGQDTSTPGIMTNLIDIPKSGVYRISIEANISDEPKAVRPHIRVCDQAGERLGPDFEIKAGSLQAHIFVPFRATKIKIFIICYSPRIGYKFIITSVLVELINSNDWLEGTRQKIKRPVIASLASIPARRTMLRDCVESLLVQCDKVRVFLNGYEAVPDYLEHERVEVRRSQDWDDKGDAGKFGWVEVPDVAGYRVIVDDDLVFPPDFSEKMTDCLKSYDNKAIVGAHGIILKQPITQYYDPESRFAIHFQSVLSQDRTVHLLGTNALCYESSRVKMRWADFMFRNMADVFLAKYAQENGLPMIAVSRPQYWIRQNSQEGGFATIYEESLKRTKSKFDSSMVQDSVIKKIAPLTIQKTNRPKIAVILLATAIDAFKSAWDSFEKTAWNDSDWVIIVVDLTDHKDLEECIKITKSRNEFHIIGGATINERFQNSISLLHKIGFNSAIVTTDSIRFNNRSWAKISADKFSGSPSGSFYISSSNKHGENKSELTLGSWNAAFPPVAVVFSPLALENVGNIDLTEEVRKFSIYDWMIRLGRSRPESEKIIDLDVETKTRIEKSFDIVEELTPKKIFNEKAVKSTLFNSSRVKINNILNNKDAPNLKKKISINDVFERVLVINLDRRADRWESVSLALRSAGITASRFSAVDGKSAEVSDDYNAYASSKSLAVPTNVRQIKSSHQFYQDYDSQSARVAFAEKDDGRAIKSAGAWAYLKTWERILEQALIDKVESLLVFDDDVVFHRDTAKLFSSFCASSPSDWLILQLGTLQYHWTDDWMTWRGDNIYQTNGSAIGSHAVGIKFEAIPYLLENVKRMQLPFDTGALSAITRDFRERCLVVYPNIAIQSLSDSDIGTSGFQNKRSFLDIYKEYRWKASDYLITPPFGGKVIGARAQVLTALAPLAASSLFSVSQKFVLKNYEKTSEDFRFFDIVFRDVSVLLKNYKWISFKFAIYKGRAQIIFSERCDSESYFFSGTKVPTVFEESGSGDGISVSSDEMALDQATAGLLLLCARSLSSIPRFWSQEAALSDEDIVHWQAVASGFAPKLISWIQDKAVAL